jgi:nitrogen-specific signal transduction histidine kinase
MSGAQDISLLAHLRTPILVGDPDGCIVYANPAFRSRFCQVGEDPMGQPLDMVFGGGAREVVLGVTAEVLQRGQSVRLQIREGEFAYTGMASPIEAQDDRVGVIMVLLEEQSNDEFITGLADEIGEPISDVIQSMQMLSLGLEGQLAEDQTAIVERGLRSAESAQKWLRELQVAIRGGKTQRGRFDVSNSIMRVVDRISNDTEIDVDFEVLMPPNLPRVAGASAIFERLLTALVRKRIAEAKSGEPLTLLARTLGGDQPRGVLVSLVDIPDSTRRSATGFPPEVVQHGMASMGGDAICVEDSTAGRVTLMRLSLAST